MSAWRGSSERWHYDYCRGTIRYLCEARKALHIYAFTTLTKFSGRHDKLHNPTTKIWKETEGMCSAKNLYSAIDSSSIINIDLTSNADLALGVKFRTFYDTARRLDYVSGKLFGEIAARESGNNLLRMQRQINNFFLRLLGCHLCFRLDFFVPCLSSPVERILHCM